MFEEEKQELEKQISDKSSRLQEIKQEQQEIKEREEIIEKYTEVIKDLKYEKNLIKFVFFLELLIGSGCMLIDMIPVVAMSFCIISFLIVGKNEIIRYFKAKKVIKKNKAQYEEAKASEEKDKELSLTLSNEYTKIEQDILPLQYRLSRLKKIDAMEQLGYQLELMASKLNDQYLCMIDNQNKENYEQLWEQYLIESKDYSKVHLYNPRIDSTQVLVKKL